MERRILEELLHVVGGQLRIRADGDGELDVVLLREAVQPAEELVHLGAAVAGDDLAQAVDEDVGDVVVAGVHAADKALQGGVIGDIVLAGLHQADVVVDVEGELVALFDADHVAVLGLDGIVDQLDDVLGLAGALLAHDNANHVYHSLSF